MQPEVFYGLLQRAHADLPGAFTGKGEPALPLAIHTDKALSAAWPDMSKSSVLKFLRCHFGSPSYLKALAAGGPRYDLDGSVIGEVSATDRADAIRRLEALKQRRMELAKAA